MGCYFVQVCGFETNDCALSGKRMTFRLGEGTGYQTQGDETRFASLTDEDSFSYLRETPDRTEVFLVQSLSSAKYVTLERTSESGTETLIYHGVCQEEK